MVDKKYCMSSYMALRYIEDDDKDFYDGKQHKNITPISMEERTPVRTADDIDREITKAFDKLRNRKLGVMLSGGMDSAICASYMGGSDAYTFRFLGGVFCREELKRAEYYASYYGLHLHYVDISWDTVEQYTDIVMEAKAVPVHSIEPQLFQAALQAKEDGVEMLVVGESSDLIFGGMDQLIGRDWSFDDFMRRDCANFAPISPPHFRRYDVGDIKKDLSVLFENIAYVELLQIQGGEPLLYSDLIELVDFLGENKHKVHEVVVATNGSIIPTDEVLDCLKKNDVLVRVSDYGIVKETAFAFMEKLRAKQLRSFFLFVCYRKISLE